MKKLWALVVLAAMVAAFPAYAGRRTGGFLWVTRSADGSGVFQGQMGEARASSYAAAWVTCAAYSWASTDYRYGTCYVNTGTDSAGCTTSNPRLVAAIDKLPGDGLVYAVFDASGTCTAIIGWQGSDLQPKPQ